MRSKRMRLFAAVAVICALAAGGAAFTFTNVLPSDTVAGYNNIAVSGATITAINNTLSTDGQTITGVSMTFSPAIDPDATVEIGWGPTAGTAPTSLSSTGCTVAGTGLSATCTGLTQSTETANEFAVAVYK
jgi:hypothetical protein